MLNRNLLKAEIAKEGYTQGKLAEAIGMTSNTMSDRMLGKSPFNTDEIDKICLALKIVDNNKKAAIFLSSSSQKREM